MKQSKAVHATWTSYTPCARRNVLRLGPDSVRNASPSTFQNYDYDLQLTSIHVANEQPTVAVTEKLGSKCCPSLRFTFVSRWHTMQSPSAGRSSP